MMLVGPGLDGRQDTVARLLSQHTKVVLVVDESVRPLHPDPRKAEELRDTLEYLGSTLVDAHAATEDFFGPIVENHVMSNLPPAPDVASMSPEQRRQLLDKRLDGVNKFPSLPDTQRKVSELDDLDPPKWWARAIEPDLPTKTVILRLLNSAHYGFRSRIESIEHAVSLASAKTIRSIVLACTVGKLFQKIGESRIDQFWRHSIATAFYAKLLALPAAPGEQSPQQKTELVRFQLDSAQRAWLEDKRVWTHFEDVDEGKAFSCGMLQDVGKVAMALCFEDALLMLDPIVQAEFQRSQRDGALWSLTPRKVERILMKDLDHQTIGGRIAERWELDETTTKVISHHHDASGSSPSIIRLIALADLAANLSVSYPFEGEYHPLTILAERVKKGVEKRRGMSRPEAIEDAFRFDIASELDDTLEGMGVHPTLLEEIDPVTFFTVALTVAPQVGSSARTFLQMTSAGG